MTTILISDNKDIIDEAISKGRTEIVCSLHGDDVKILKNRTPYIDKELIIRFLSDLRDNINPLQNLLLGEPNVKLSGRSDSEAPLER